MTLNDKVTLITGGAKRAGKQIALTLAKSGSHIVITYRKSKGEAKRAIEEIKGYGVESLALFAEASSSSDAHNVIAAVLKKFGRLDILVNNAANFFRVPFKRLTERDFDVAINTNLKGPYLYSVAAGKVMLKQKAGKIINIADWAGLRPYKNYLPYCVSKGGVITLTKALAKSLAPHVQVNAILPGPILLPEKLSAREKRKIIEETPLKRIGSPQDIAEAVRFLIEGSDFITGACLPVDGGRLIA